MSAIRQSLATRRSGRKRKRDEKYTVDAFEGLDLSASDDEPVQIDDSDSDEFAVTEVAQESENEQDNSIDAGSAGNASVENELKIEDDESVADVEPMNIPEGEDVKPLRLPKTPKHRVPRRNAEGKRIESTNGLIGEMRSRGIRLNQKHSSRDLTLIRTFGCHKEDIVPLLKGKDKWFDEITIPSRRAHRGVGGCAESFFITPERRKTHATEGWNWYYDGGGRSAFAKGQKTKSLSLEQSKTYICTSTSGQGLVFGTYPNQKLFKIPLNIPFDINTGGAHSANANGKFSSNDSDSTSRKGWILNVGDAVRCLAWVPNQDGTNQYLALSTRPFSNQTSDISALLSDRSIITPAYSPLHSAPSSIHIWKFATKEAASGTRTCDMRSDPRLRMVLCLPWGGVKEFKWSPVTIENRSQYGDDTHFGLLAVLAEDGKVRVLDVSCDASRQDETCYIKVEQTAFESCPRDTVCTCITWISSTIIAAGCANGHVVIWDLEQHTSQPQGPNDAVIFYQSLHLTYISSIAACGPSRSHLLLTSSVDGYHRLTSIHDPCFDFVLSTRSRVNTSNIIWHEHSQHAFAADDSHVVRGYNVRNFFQSALMTQEEASIVCLATSPVHPTLLIGRADGTIVFYNPTRRLMHRRTGGDHFRQPWLKHEWRRGRPSEEKMADILHDVDKGEQSTSGASQFAPSQNERQPPQLDYPNGLTRIVIGFKVESLQDSAPRGGTKKSAAARVAQGGIIYATIYEDKSCVRSLAWNPNLECGGWAAAGMGGGLCFVEDVSYD